MNIHSARNIPSLPLPSDLVGQHFEGRFKTVKTKRVTYQSMNRDDQEGAYGAAAFSAAAGAIGAASSGFNIPIVIAAPTVAGLAPVGSFMGGYYLLNRKVHWEECQIEMTPQEIEAAMSPVERAQSDIQKGLAKWKEIRKAQHENLQNILGTTQTLRRDVEAMVRQVKVLPDPAVSFLTPEEEVAAVDGHQQQLKLEAKQSVLKEQERILEAVTRIYTTLDEEIRKREAKLYQTGEQLGLMAQQQIAINMHKQLETVKGQTSGAPEQPGEKPSPAAYDLECQRVRLEELMKEITLACDVNQVLAQQGTSPFKH